MEYAQSGDGTRIAYDRSGAGPPLVLVHGSLNDRNVWNAVLGALEERLTVYRMDRRGRGESGEPREHALEREFEDVAAVIDAAGEPVNLIGHSYGAHCALGAAAMAPDRIHRLVLYEPPTVVAERRDVAELFETQDASDAVATFMGMIGLSTDQIGALKATPFWDYLTSFASTMPSEGRALVSHGFDASRFGGLTMPALFLVGSQTEQTLGETLRELRGVMPQAEWMTFEGQGHAAQMTAPKLFSDTVLAFLDG